MLSYWCSASASGSVEAPPFPSSRLKWKQWHCLYLVKWSSTMNSGVSMARQHARPYRQTRAWGSRKLPAITLFHHSQFVSKVDSWAPIPVISNSLPTSTIAAWAMSKSNIYAHQPNCNQHSTRTWSWIRRTKWLLPCILEATEASSDNFPAIIMAIKRISVTITTHAIVLGTPLRHREPRISSFC